MVRGVSITAGGGYYNLRVSTSGGYGYAVGSPDQYGALQCDLLYIGTVGSVKSCPGALDNRRFALAIAHFRRTA
ncbi:hypothetical protein WS90_25100 [Burkholderia cepacia]|uniref:Uncharacterized protein n=1 Tax=Burkholderia cepacia TaxID=292 RepID=A0A103Z9P5_BURCE|nr:hypothetical protein WS90_25100 [Burkholderia cepacia]